MHPRVALEATAGNTDPETYVEAGNALQKSPLELCLHSHELGNITKRNSFHTPNNTSMERLITKAS